MEHSPSQPLSSPKLILASASPRRCELLEQIGVRYRVVAAALDEQQLRDESPGQCVQRLALAKAQHVRERAGSSAAVVLGADTAVVLEGRMLGKPADRDEHLRMMSALSGRVHQVLTAVAVVSTRAESVCLSESQVQLRELSAAEALAYWATGEPADKAGGYAIQEHGDLIVSEISGSYTNVVGLPLERLSEELEKWDGAAV